MTRNGAKRRAKNNRAAIVPKLVSRRGGTFGVAVPNLIARDFSGYSFGHKRVPPTAAGAVKDKRQLAARLKSLQS